MRRWPTRAVVFLLAYELQSLYRSTHDGQARDAYTAQYLEIAVAARTREVHIGLAEIMDCGGRRLGSDAPDSRV